MKLNQLARFSLLGAVLALPFVAQAQAQAQAWPGGGMRTAPLSLNITPDMTDNPKALQSLPSAEAADRLHQDTCF